MTNLCVTRDTALGTARAKSTRLGFANRYEALSRRHLRHGRAPARYGEDCLVDVPRHLRATGSFRAGRIIRPVHRDERLSRPASAERGTAGTNGSLTFRKR